MGLSKSNLHADQLSGAEAALLELMLEESEKRINAQVQVMLAADTRSTGILAAAVALGAAAFALAANVIGKPDAAPLFWGTAAFGFVATGGAIAAVWALWPTAIQVSGWSPNLFRNDIHKSVARVRAEMIALNQKKIDENATCSGRLTKRARLAMTLLVLSPIVGAASGAAAQGANWAISTAAYLFSFVGLFLAAVLPGILAKEP